MTVLTLCTPLCAYFIVCSFFILICVHYCIDVVAVVVVVVEIHSIQFNSIDLLVQNYILLRAVDLCEMCVNGWGVHGSAQIN